MSKIILIFFASIAFLIFGIVMIASFLKSLITGYQKLENKPDDTIDKSHKQINTKSNNKLESKSIV